MSAIARYLKNNALAALALFIALGGTGYAAVAIPRSSVGTSQLRNGAVTPAKLASRQIAGSIYAWAYIAADGKVLVAHGLRHGDARGVGGQYGFALINQHVSRHCAATASVALTTTEQGTLPGTAIALFSPRRNGPSVKGPAGVGVNTFNAAGQPAQLPFVVQVLC